MSEKKFYNVTNRSDSMVDYLIPEDNLRRTFAPNETKKISFEEIEKLSFIPGGMNLLRDYLQVSEAEVLDALDMEVEPEYNMTAKDVQDLLMTGSLDSFLDCLDFAPDGVLDLVKRIAVDLPLNDVSKRQAIKEKLGFDVSAAIQHKREAEEEDNGPILKQPERRVKKETKAPGRRTETPKYKILGDEPKETK